MQSITNRAVSDAIAASCHHGTTSHNVHTHARFFHCPLPPTLTAMRNGFPTYSTPARAAGFVAKCVERGAGRHCSTRPKPQPCLNSIAWPYKRRPPTPGYLSATARRPRVPIPPRRKPACFKSHMARRLRSSAARRPCAAPSDGSAAPQKQAMSRHGGDGAAATQGDDGAPRLLRQREARSDAVSRRRRMSHPLPSAASLSTGAVWDAASLNAGRFERSLHAYVSAALDTCPGASGCATACMCVRI